MKKIILLFLAVLFFKTGKAQNNIIGGDSTNLESNTSIIHIDTTVGNIWQIGLPQKTFFGTAHSAPYAIMTDTINSYPINNFSTFTDEYPSLNHYAAIGNVYIGFWHKYETDTLKDGGYIEISLDSGAAWINIANAGNAGMQIRNPINFYDNYSGTTINGNIPAFTGTQNNWKYSAIQLQWMAGVIAPFSNGNNNRMLRMTNKVMYRFVFKSDNIQTNKAGWIIDNIVINNLDIGGGIQENEMANFDVKVHPNPISEKGIIQVVPKNNEHDFTINIYNTIGQLISSSKMDKNNQFIINKNDLISGMYLYSVISKDGTFKTGKLLIK